MHAFTRRLINSLPPHVFHSHHDHPRGPFTTMPTPQAHEHLPLPTLEQLVIYEYGVDHAATEIAHLEALRRQGQAVTVTFDRLNGELSWTVERDDSGIAPLDVVTFIFGCII